MKKNTLNQDHPAPKIPPKLEDSDETPIVFHSQVKNLDFEKAKEHAFANSVCKIDLGMLQERGK